MLTRPRTALLGALASLGALTACGVLAEVVPAFKVRDSASLRGFASLGDSHLSPVLERIAHLGDPDAYAVLAFGVLLTAFGRGRRRMAAVLAVVLVAAPACTEILKHLTASPRGTTWLGYTRIAEASWPSGHATALMTLTLCAIVAAPPWARPAVALAGGLLSTCVAYAVVVLVHHFPSDVVGGFLMAGTWALAAVAFLRRGPGAPAEPAPAPSPRLVVLLSLAAGAAGLGLAASRVGSLADHPSFTVAAVVIAALAAGLSGALVRLARG